MNDAIKNWPKFRETDPVVDINRELLETLELVMHDLGFRDDFQPIMVLPTSTIDRVRTAIQKAKGKP